MSLEIKSGLLRMHSDIPSINTSADKSQAASIADVSNTPEYLIKAFFKESPYFLTNTDLASGGKVSVVEPTGKYSEEAFLVMAAGPESFQQSGVTTEAVYKYPRDVQEAYWHSVTTIMTQLESRKKPNTQVIATENCIARRTDGEKRTSRTIALPHVQVFTMDETQIEDLSEHGIAHLTQEQAVLERVIQNEKTLQEISRLINLALGSDSNVVLTGRSQKSPYGYEFPVAAVENIAMIATVLNAHHSAYTEVAQSLEAALTQRNKDRIIPQPSYRLYLTTKNNQLWATISPEFISHAGVLEAAGVVLQRSTEIPPRISKEEKNKTRQSVLQALLAGTTQSK